jgi:hypothetical protein
LPLSEGGNNLFGSKKTSFSSRFRMSFFGFLFLGELGTCPQNLMHTQDVEPWGNHQFPQGGMLKFTYKRPFFDNKNRIWKILGLKIQTVKTCPSASSTHRNFNFWKTLKISIFGGILKFLKLIVFGQILANFGSLGQFWADCSALAVADSMSKLRLKSLKPHNFWTMSPNVTCCISLENYNPYL